MAAKKNAGDPVSHPAHYSGYAGAPEAIDICEGLDFIEGNVVKYLLRAPFKGSPVTDIQKARWYWERMQERVIPKEDYTISYGQSILPAFRNTHHSAALKKAVTALKKTARAQGEKSLVARNTAEILDALSFCHAVRVGHRVRKAEMVRLWSDIEFQMFSIQHEFETKQP